MCIMCVCLRDRATNVETSIRRGFCLSCVVFKNGLRGGEGGGGV